MSLFEKVMNIIREGEEDDFKAIVSSEMLMALSRLLTPIELQDIIIAKNIRIYGDVNLYIQGFVEQTKNAIQAMPEGPQKEATKKGQKAFIEKLLTRTDISEESRRLLEHANLAYVAAAPAAGGKRRGRRANKKTRRARSKGTRKH